MMNIALTNLGKYNEGFLIGEWVDLPVSDEELKAVFDRIGISDKPDAYGRYYEEYFITDYETDIEGLKIGEYESISRLNEIAEQLEDVDEEQFAAAYNYACNLEEAIDILDDVMYVTTPDIWESEEEAVGYYYAKECGCLNIPEEIENYFDFEAYGRDIMLNGSFYTAESGAIYEVIR